MKFTVMKYVALFFALIFTVGAIIPWLINTDQIPVAFIMAGVLSIVCAWIWVLEKPAKKIFYAIKRGINEQR